MMLIEVYKIIKGCYDREASSFLKLMSETGLRFRRTTDGRTNDGHQVMLKAHMTFCQLS
jgi:hypothetical protein